MATATHKIKAVPGAWRVVIAFDQVYLSLETTTKGRHVAQAKVAQMIDGVLRIHHGIPVVDQNLIHFLQGVEGSIAISDYVAVSKVCVTDYQGLHSV